MGHDVIFGGQDNEAVEIRCKKCQANARFLIGTDAVPAEGGGFTVTQELQDQWLGSECPAA